jgi:hypothetical protein
VAEPPEPEAEAEIVEGSSSASGAADVIDETRRTPAPGVGLEDFAQLKEQQRERTRAYIAYGLLGLLYVIVMGSGTILAAGWARWEELSDYLNLVFTTVAALSGAAFGFFFGERR